MLDFQATDAVGMRVQSVAKIDGLLNVVSAWKGQEMENVSKRVNVVTIGASR